jgi:hypothetical protein
MKLSVVCALGTQKFFYLLLGKLHGDVEQFPDPLPPLRRHDTASPS